MKAHILSANRTDTGLPVYLDPQGIWQTQFDQAAVYSCQTKLSNALTSAKQLEAYICDPFSIKVDIRNGRPASSEQKWTIRADGADATMEALGYAPERFARQPA